MLLVQNAIGTKCYYWYKMQLQVIMPGLNNKNINDNFNVFFLL